MKKEKCPHCKRSITPVCPKCGRKISPGALLRAKGKPRGREFYQRMASMRKDRQPKINTEHGTETPKQI